MRRLYASNDAKASHPLYVLYPQNLRMLYPQSSTVFACPLGMLRNDLLKSVEDDGVGAVADGVGVDLPACGHPSGYQWVEGCFCLEEQSGRRWIVFIRRNVSIASGSDLLSERTRVRLPHGSSPRSQCPIRKDLDALHRQPTPFVPLHLVPTKLSCTVDHGADADR